MRIYSHAELVEILSQVTAIDNDAVPLFLLMAFCGVRQVEFEKMLWEYVDAPNYMLTFPQKAYSRNRRTPIPLDAGNWIDLYKSEYGEDPVYPIYDMDGMWRVVGETVGHQCPGTLRDSYIAYALAAGEPAEELAKATGEGKLEEYKGLATMKDAVLWFTTTRDDLPVIKPGKVKWWQEKKDE